MNLLATPPSSAHARVNTLQNFEATFPFKRVGMVGDSITFHSQWWVAGRNRLLTARAGIDLDFRNLSIPGDSAVDALERYEWDIGPADLSTAIVMLGMNDVWREGYAEFPPKRETLIKRREAIARHLQSIRSLVERFQRDGIRVLLLSSTPYEQEATLEIPNCHGIDDALGECAAAGRCLAEEMGVSFFSVREPMLQINRRLRLKNPGATILGKDRVHPETLGHGVLGHLVFENFISENGNVHIGLTEGIAYRGPLPDVAENPEALALLGTQGRKILVKAKKRKGRWMLCIDGTPVHTADAEAWLSGVDLAGLESPLLQLGKRIHQAGLDLDREEKRYRNLLMFQGWAFRGGHGKSGAGFMAYLEERKKEDSPENWLALAAEDASILIGTLEEHHERTAFLRSSLAEITATWSFRMELIAAST